MGRILLADDDNAFRQMLVTVLERSGHDVDEAENGIVVLEKLGGALLQCRPYDLVISDVHMPGWTGLGLLAEIHDEPWAPPVILMTSFGDEKIHRSALDLGAVAILDKPLDLENLRDTVRRALSRAAICGNSSGA